MSEKFAYTLRESPRAKNIRLKVTLQHGLEVIVPKGYDRALVPQLLERKKVWIRTALERAETMRKFFEPRPKWRIPAQIHLRAIGRVFHVDAKETKSARVTVRSTGTDTIEIRGRIRSGKACRVALIRWLARQTREHLAARLQVLSGRTGLKYQRVFVRQQKTRWASCSQRGTISLNLKLLFLPPQLVDYVLIHELCHVAVMNHSKQFWSLVQAHCPGYRKPDAELREMWKIVPRWIDPFPRMRRKARQIVRLV